MAPKRDAERTKRFAARDDQRSGRRELLRQEPEFAADAVGRLVPGQAGRQVKARQSDTCLILGARRERPRCAVPHPPA